MQRLQPRKHARQRLYGSARDVVERLLTSQVDAGRLTVEFESPRLGVFDFQSFSHDSLPDSSSCPAFGDFLKETDRKIEKEGKSFQKLLRVKPALDAILGELNCGCKRESHGLCRSCAGLLGMLPDHRQRIPVWNVLLAKRDVIDQDSSRPRERQAEKHVICNVV